MIVSNAIVRFDRMNSTALDKDFKKNSLKNLTIKFKYQNFDKRYT